MSKKFKPRIILPPLPKPRQKWRIIFVCAIAIILLFDGIMAVREADKLQILKRKLADANAEMGVLATAINHMTPPAKDDAEPLPDLNATPSAGYVSETLPETDAPPISRPHRAAKAEPSADELNARWLVRYPHGAPALEPLP